MGSFVVVRSGCGVTEFVSDTNTNGTGGSYSTNIAKAKRFRTADDASGDCCGNESVHNIDDFLAGF